MNDHEKLKRVRMFSFPKSTYEVAKRLYFRSFNQYLDEDCTVCQAVNGHYYHGIDTAMEENGMDKFAAMLIGMLFMMEHDDVDEDQAKETSMDINDFETGEYDDLFTEEDLALIRADIQKIKDYLAQHPELLQD